MAELPDPWRTEVWHPLSVHLPIVALSLGTGLWLLGRVLGRRARFAFLLPAGRLLLVLGVLGAWGAVYTGSLADGVVGRTLCDPTVAKLHEQLAWATALTFSAALALDMLLFVGLLGVGGRGRILGRRPWRQAVTGLVATAMLGGTGMLVYAAHLGGTLVYQQAAAVYRPAADCRAFE